MLFAAAGIAEGVLADSAGLQTHASMETWELGRKIATVLLNSYAMRMAAVFMMSTATIGFRTRFMPRWLVFSGFLIAIVLLLGIDLTRWVELLFPIWVLLFSLDTLVESFTGRRALAVPGR